MGNESILYFLKIDRIEDETFKTHCVKSFYHYWLFAQLFVLLCFSSKNPEEAELEDTLNQVVSVW